MAKKNFTAGINQTINHSAAVETLQGIRLSDVIRESPKKLRANSLNSDFFAEETSEYFENLRRDVKERGILVPLVARQDGTLLAGHNRLQIAQELNLPFVPVQYVLDALSEDEERTFVISDNLLRRQLTNAERLALYRALYPNFEARLAARTNGRPKTRNDRETKKGEDFPLSESLGEKPLNAAIIARDTGQSRETVKKQLQNYRKEPEQLKRKHYSPSEHNTSDNELGAVNTAIIKKVEKSLQPVMDSNTATKKVLAKVLREFVRKLV
jgi:hypothetical protein